MANRNGKDEIARVATLCSEDGTSVVVTVLGEEHDQNERSSQDRMLIARYLHHSGDLRHALTAEEAWSLYCLADGFGRRTPDELLEINDGWDWSHVRDSSPEALATIRCRLEALAAGRRRG